MLAKPLLTLEEDSRRAKDCSNLVNYVNYDYMSLSYV